MPSKPVNIPVTTTGTDKARANLGKVDNAIKGMAKSAIAFGAAYFSVRGVISAFNTSVKAAQEQERAEARLAQIATQVTGATAAQVQEFKDLAAAMQSVGVVGDEAVIAGQSQIASFTKSAAVVTELTDNLADLAVAQYGTNVSQEQMIQTANQLGKALAGQLDGLTRGGVLVNDTYRAAFKAANTEQERAVILSKILDDNYGGLNETLRQTSEGGVQAMKNALGDTAEVLGSRLTPGVGVLAEKITAIQPVIQNFIKNIDISGTLANVLERSKTWGAAYVEVYTAIFDYLPDLAKAAFRKIVQYAPEVLGKAFKWIINATKWLWEPMVVAAQIALLKTEEFFVISGAKISNTMTNAVNKIKESFNDMADGWLAEKLGIEPLQTKDLIDVEGLGEGFAQEIAALKERLKGTDLVQMFTGGERTIETAEEFTAALSAIYEKYFAGTIDMDREVTDEQEQNDERRKQSSRGAAESNIEGMQMQIKTANIMGAALSRAFDPGMSGGAKIKAFITDLLSAMQGVILASEAVSSALTFTFTGPAGIAAAIASLAALEAAKAMVNAIKFEDGGIVPGTSYSGDRVPVRVNSGEMVLNSQQQATLFDIANGRQAAAQQQSGGAVSNVMNMDIRIEGDFLGTEEQADKLAQIIEKRARQGFNKLVTTAHQHRVMVGGGMTVGGAIA